MDNKELCLCTELQINCNHLNNAYSNGFNDGKKEKRVEIETKLYNDFIELSKKCATIKKENKALKAQIKKLKCCENCKHHKIDYERRLSCNIAQYKTCDKWEPEK